MDYVSVYNIKLASDEYYVTPEIQAFLDQLMVNKRDAMKRIINSEHCQFVIDLNYDNRRKKSNDEITDNMLEFRIEFDLPDSKDAGKIISVLYNENLKRTPSKIFKDFYLTGTYLTASYGRRDKIITTHEYFYKCPGFDDAYLAIKKLLPNLSEKKFSKLDENLTHKCHTLQATQSDRLIYTKNTEKYDTRYTLMTIYIANSDIVPNITILNEVIQAISDLWFTA